MICQLMRWSALVLLVCAATSLAVVKPLVITRMTWSQTPDTGFLNPEKTDLTVCLDAADTLAEADNIIRLVVYSDAGQKTFDGSLGDTANCAQFSEEEDLTLPSTEAAFYKLTVSDKDTGAELSSGSVSFAYPVVTSEIINCGETTIGRLTLTEASPTNCIEGSSGFMPELCYVEIDEENTVCVAGLDTNSDVVVCTTNIQNTVVAVPDVLTVKYISYGDVDTSLVASYERTDPGDLTELLSRVEGGDGSVTVHPCSDLSCVLSSFSPSTDNYELCGVFTESITASVTHVGITTFQDLKLTVDSPSPTVDFHFYNVVAGNYNVYQDADLNNLGGATVSFILDCSRITAESYCNGFIQPDEGGILPSTIAVSFTDATNVVVTSVASNSQEPDEAVLS